MSQTKIPLETEATRCACGRLWHTPDADHVRLLPDDDATRQLDTLLAES